MTRKLFVGRHGPAKEWAMKNGHADATFVEHLDPGTIAPGDLVLGTLPAHIAAEVCRRGGRYMHLAVDIPKERRGEELAMETLSPRLVELRVRRIGPRLRIRQRLGALLRHPHRTSVRRLRMLRLRLAERPGWMVVILGFLGFWVLSMPSVAVATLADLYGCLFPDQGAACGGLRWALVIGQLAVELVVYLIAFYVLSQIVGAIIWSRMRRLAGRDARSRALIIGLSHLNELGLAALPKVIEHFNGRAFDFALPSKAFNEHLVERGLAPPPEPQPLRKPQISGYAIQWQQIARAICQHGKTLECVLVLPSDASWKQWQQFLAFIGALFPKEQFPKLTVDFVRGDDQDAFALPDVSGAPVRDYEDYAFVRDGLNRAVDQLRAHAGEGSAPLTEADICVDVTPGPKLFSIGAAIATLNRELRLSYVSNEGQVQVFDAEIGTADSLTRTLN